MGNFQIYGKIDSFLKNVLNVETVGENKAKLKKLFNLNSTLRWAVQYPRHTEYTHFYQQCQ